MQVLLAFPVAGLLAAASGPGGVADERPIRSIGFLVLDWDLSQLAFRRAPGARMPGPAGEAGLGLRTLPPPPASQWQR